MTRKKPGPPPKADWEAIEREYRAGVLSIEQIAKNHGITSGAIKKRAKREGWTRDLKPQVDDMIGRYLVPIGIRNSTDENEAGAEDQDEQARRRAREAEEEEIAREAARRSLEVILTHRRDISRARSLTEMLLGELTAVTIGREQIEQLIDVLFAGGGVAGGMERAALRQVLRLGERAKTLVNVTKALEQVVKLERQAFGLSVDPVKAPADPVEIEENRQSATVSHTDEELARAVLGIIERASRAKAGATKH